MTLLRDVDGLSAADVMHRHVTTLPATATVGNVRDYFAASGSHRLAMLVDDGRFVGAIAVAALPRDVDGSAAAADYATRAPTIDPRASARDARDVALAQPSRRLPVVDDAGTLVGIVAIGKRRDRFCGA